MIDDTLARYQKLRGHAALSAALILLSFAAAGSAWQGSTELHTVIEAVATVVALITGVVALARYHANNSNTYLFIGSGFIGAALLDGYHTIVTSHFFALIFPSPRPR